MLCQYLSVSLSILLYFWLWVYKCCVSTLRYPCLFYSIFDFESISAVSVPFGIPVYSTLFLTLSLWVLCQYLSVSLSILLYFWLWVYKCCVSTLRYPCLFYSIFDFESISAVSVPFGILLYSTLLDIESTSAVSVLFGSSFYSTQGPGGSMS